MGQLYVLSTGQGDSQKDAKYDQVPICNFNWGESFINILLLTRFLTRQCNFRTFALCILQFFLGDYRPLIQDIYGNVLDQVSGSSFCFPLLVIRHIYRHSVVANMHLETLIQESQLPPYRRNMEDPLCDSGFNLFYYGYNCFVDPSAHDGHIIQSLLFCILGMIPYEEPYQTMFQKRRLGALGKEWRPSSLKLAVGPDITLDQDYQMPPLADLDLAEPLPEFIDAMEWEPEVDILSDENDSEYNVPEEYSTGKEQECLHSSASGESGSSSGESDEDDDHQNSLRRSKRKNHKREVSILQYCFDVVPKYVTYPFLPHYQAGIMTSSGRRVKKRNFDELEGAPSNNKRTRKSRSGRKESKRKSSKSKSSRPRRAAARNALSWFSKITGTSKDAEEEGVSELSDSSESESTTQDSGTGDSEPDVALINGHGKQSKGKNILVCDSDDGAQPCDIRGTHPTERRRLVVRFPVRNSDKLTLLENLPGSSSDVPTQTLGNCYADDLMVPRNLEIHTNQFEGLDASQIRWGMVKARTSKRMRGEAMSSHGVMGSEPEGKENNVNEDANHHDNGVTAPSCLELKTDMNGMAVDTDTVISNGLPDGEERCLGLDGSPSQLADDGASNCSQDVNGHLHDLIDSLPPISRKLRIRSKRVSRAPDASLKQEGKSSSIDQETGGSDALNDGSADTRCDLALDCQKNGVAGTELSLRNDCLRESNPQISDPVSVANDVPVSHSHPKRMFAYVYRRLKLRNQKNNSDRGATLTQEISPESCSQDQSSGANSHECASNGFHGTQSNGLEKSEGSLTTIRDKISDSCGNQNSQGEWRSTSGATLRLRSTRNRRSTYPFSETKPIETKKPQQLIEIVSWLTLSTHEEGSRYIPQKGDEVAYLRQVSICGDLVCYFV